MTLSAHTHDSPTVFGAKPNGNNYSPNAFNDPGEQERR